MKIPAVTLGWMRVRSLVAAGCFVALLTGGVWPILSPFRPAPAFPTIGERQRAERRELQCFAVGVLERTPARASIVFLVPAGDSDGGLIDHRLRYVLPGRQILKSGPAEYVAAWHRPLETGNPIWTGCGGVLVRR
jgi:hypothetical protein